MSERESDMERVSGFKREREGTVNVYAREREREREREFFHNPFKKWKLQIPQIVRYKFRVRRRKSGAH